MQNLQVGQFANINIFTLKPGKRDEFIELQRAALPTLGEIKGFSGSQLYRARDDDQVIQIAFFDDQTAHQRFLATEAFQQHRQLVHPLVDVVVPGYFTLTNQNEASALTARATTVE